MKNGFRIALALSLFPVLLMAQTGSQDEDSSSVYARQRQTLAAMKQSYDRLQDKQSTKLLFSPVPLPVGTSVTVVAPADWRALVEKVQADVKQTHERFEALFGALPPVQTSIRLMPEADFFQRTGAPAWTNAMYYHGEILLPVDNPKTVDLKNIKRSVRHEYAHAIIHALSAGKCPGWLDEGIAQWVEGIENPALKPALRDWLEKNPPVSLRLLQGGFTRLKEDMVPAAYAQSLFATTTLINAYGFPTIRQYFDQLQIGTEGDSAFHKSFSLREELFEVALGKKIMEWHKTTFHQ